MGNLLAQPGLAFGELLMDSEIPAGFATLLQHHGEEDLPYRSVVPPLIHNSLFTFEDVEAFQSVGDGRTGPYAYSRVGNPTVRIAERKLARLEGAEDAKLVAGGAAGLAAVVLTSLQDGNHIVAVETAYGTSRVVAESVMGKYGASVTLVDGRDPQEVLDAIRPETALIVLESPSGMVFQLQDFEAITKVAREKGITTMSDNTYSTPLYQNPLAMGVDIVVHSCSKYLGGHSDIVGGVVCSTTERVERISALVNNLGSILSPFPAWLLIRGMRSLEVRIKRVEQTANLVAVWLESRPEVALVRHVGLPSHPQRDLARHQMRGSTGILSFEPVSQDRAALNRFLDALTVFQRGVSWGGFESLALGGPLKLLGWPGERLVVRLYCGLEDPADLLADLDRAFQAASAKA